MPQSPHRIHIDSHGEQALRQCLPPSLYELFLATRAQPSKGITVFRIHGRVSCGPLTLRQILLAGLDDIMHFNKAFARYEQQDAFGFGRHLMKQLGSSGRS